MSRPPSPPPMDSGLNILGPAAARETTTPAAASAPAADAGRAATASTVDLSTAGGSPTADGPADSRRDRQLAALAYLSVPFTLFLVPLGVYLYSWRGHELARRHAAQAGQLAVTALLYTVCGLIIGAVLALDSLQVAALVAVPLLALLWLSVLVVAVARERPVSQ
jgi:hypothetical protein